MNLPNIITLSRIPFLFIIVGLLYMPWPGAATLAFFLFVLAGLTDWLDGYLARKQKLISTFGKLMDSLTDKILVVGLFVALLGLQILPSSCVFLVLLIIGREFLITGLRLVAASTGAVLASEKSGKQKTVSQILSIGILLFVHALERDFTAWTPEPLIHWASTAGILFFILASFLTVISGIYYMVKHWKLFTQA